MSGQKLDTMPLSREDYEVQVNDGLRNTLFSIERALGKRSILSLDASLNIILAQSAALHSLQKKWKSITESQLYQPRDLTRGME